MRAEVGGWAKTKQKKRKLTDRKGVQTAYEGECCN